MDPSDGGLQDLIENSTSDSDSDSIQSETPSSMAVSCGDNGKRPGTSEETTTVEKSGTKTSDSLTAPSEMSTAKGHRRARSVAEPKFLEEFEKQVRFTGIDPWWQTSPWYPVTDVYHSIRDGKLGDNTEADSNLLKAAEALTWCDCGKGWIIGDAKVEGTVSPRHLGEGGKLDWKYVRAPKGMLPPNSPEKDRVHFRYEVGPKSQTISESFTLYQRDFLDCEENDGFYQEIKESINRTLNSLSGAKAIKASSSET